MSCNLITATFVVDYYGSFDVTLTIRPGFSADVHAHRILARARLRLLQQGGPYRSRLRLIRIKTGNRTIGVIS